MTVDDTTRTPETEGGDAPAKGTTGTPTQEVRDGTSQGDDLSKLNMEWKGKAETLNALFARYGVSSVEELNERLAQSPAAPDTPRTETDEYGAALQATRDFAAKGDPVAKLTLQVLERNEQLERGIGDAFTARDIADPAERALAVAHLNKNRHRLGDLPAALAEVRAARLGKELAAAQKELERMRKAPDPDVVGAPKTGGREGPAQTTSARKGVTSAQFDAEVARLTATGLHHQAMLYKRDTEIID